MTPHFLPTLEEQVLFPTFDLQLNREEWGGQGEYVISLLFPQSIFSGSLQGKADVEEEERLGE